MYVIVNRRGLYWNAGVCNVDKANATQFEPNERQSVRLASDERWEKV